MPSKDGWTHSHDHEKITLGRKQYRNMEEWLRPCAVCGENFSIFVRAGAGTVNSSFGLKTCKSHRGERPGANGTPAPGVVDALQSANATMREELDGLYGRVKELFEENQVLKAKLATHGIGCEPVQNTISGSLPTRMPWE